MKPHRILVIDDSSAARLLYQELLSSLDAQIEVASDGAEGWKKRRAEPFDLVVTDVDMPQLGGFDLCRLLRANPATTEIPIIIASTFDSDRDIIRGFESGATAYLSKLELREFLLSTVQARRSVRAVRDGALTAGFRTIANLRVDRPHPAVAAAPLSPSRIPKGLFLGYIPVSYCAFLRRTVWHRRKADIGIAHRGPPQTP